MATETLLHTEAEIQAMGREAHLIRTRGRITFWKEQLTKASDEATRQKVLEELQLLERQLREPLTKRVLRLNPPKTEGPVSTAWTAMQTRLAELEATLARLTKGHEPKVEESVES